VAGLFLQVALRVVPVCPSVCLFRTGF